MSLIILIGPPAVGKMTVGQELEKLSGYKLFHNHTAIELVLPYFGYDTREGRGLVSTVRNAFYDAFAVSDQPGFIITYVWAFDVDGEREYIEGVAEKFAAAGREIFWVELEAGLDERLKRNRTENRLTHKPSKRNLAWSDNNVREMSEEYRLNSLDAEIAHPNYLRLDTNNASATVTAQNIWKFVLGASS